MDSAAVTRLEKGGRSLQVAQLTMIADVLQCLPEDLFTYEATEQDRLDMYIRGEIAQARRHLASAAGSRLDDVTASVVTGKYVDPRAGRETVRAYYVRWSSRQVWVEGTVKAMTLAVTSTPFIDAPLSAVRRSDVETWIKTMSKTLQPSTIATRYNNVRALFRAAVSDQLLAVDPTAGVTLPRRRRAAAAMRIPTPAEVGRLVRAADPRFATYVQLCAFAGLRLGEASAVKVGDVDFPRRTLTVRRQVQRSEGGTVAIRAPKYGSERVVYLAHDLTLALSRHIEVNGVRPEGWLFFNAEGQPPHQNTVGYWWRTVRKAAGVEGAKLHELRHYYASGLIAEGCDVVTVQRALGHASASTTLNTYSHLWPTAEDRTRKAAGSIMATALAAPADSPAD